MANQTDAVSFSLTPIAGTFTITVDPGGLNATTGAIAFNADAPTIAAALDTATTNPSGDSVTLAGSDASGGFSNTYSGNLANLRLSTWSVDASGLIGGGSQQANYTLFLTTGNPPLVSGSLDFSGFGHTFSFPGQPLAGLQSALDGTFGTGTWTAASDDPSGAAPTFLTLTYKDYTIFGSQQWSISGNSLQDQGNNSVLVTDVWSDAIVVAVGSSPSTPTPGSPIARSGGMTLLGVG